MGRNRIQNAREFLADQSNDPADLQEALASSDRDYVATLIALLQAGEKRVKNRAVKLIARMSGQNPRCVYPHWDSLSG